MKWDVNLNLYRSFYYVAKYNGFTNASIAISLSQSTLSNNIKKLEEELNTTLFKRIGTKIKLTEDGENIYLKLKQIYDIISDDQEKKNINIGCIRFIADNYLKEPIVQFYQENSNIKLNVQILDSGKLYQMLKREELDLVISRYPTFYRFEESISVEMLCCTKNIFVCSKDFYHQNKNNFQNKKYKIPIILPNHSEKRRIIESYLKENNYNYSVILEIPNSNLLKKIIMAGLGVGYMNEKFVSEEIIKGDLVEIKNFKNTPTDTICLLYNNKSLTTETKELIDKFKTTIQKTNN